MTEKGRRGFASMDAEKQKEIASKGGRAAHAKGTAHEWSKAEARVAGRKGGVMVSQNRDHMSVIGREGGEARGRANAMLREGMDRPTPRRYVERESRVIAGREAEGGDRSAVRDATQNLPELRH